MDTFYQPIKMLCIFIFSLIWRVKHLPCSTIIGGVQFRNNSIKKIPWTAELDLAYGFIQFGTHSQEFFLFQLFLNCTSCSSMTCTKLLTSKLLKKLNANYTNFKRAKCFLIWSKIASHDARKTSAK